MSGVRPLEIGVALAIALLFVWLNMVYGIIAWRTLQCHIIRAMEAVASLSPQADVCAIGENARIGNASATGEGGTDFA